MKENTDAEEEQLPIVRLPIIFGNCSSCSYYFSFSNFLSSSVNHFSRFSFDTCFTWLKLIHFLFLKPIFQNVPSNIAFLMALPNSNQDK